MKPGLSRGKTVGTCIFYPWVSAEYGAISEVPFHSAMTPSLKNRLVQSDSRDNGLSSCVSIRVATLLSALRFTGPCPCGRNLLDPSPATTGLTLLMSWSWEAARRTPGRPPSWIPVVVAVGLAESRRVVAMACCPAAWPSTTPADAAPRPRWATAPSRGCVNLPLFLIQPECEFSVSSFMLFRCILKAGAQRQPKECTEMPQGLGRTSAAAAFRTAFSLLCYRHMTRTPWRFFLVAVAGWMNPQQKEPRQSTRKEFPWTFRA